MDVCTNGCLGEWKVVYTNGCLDGWVDVCVRMDEYVQVYVSV